MLEDRSVLVYIDEDAAAPPSNWLHIANEDRSVLVNTDEDAAAPPSSWLRIANYVADI